jgi:hypothetical protein
LLIDGSKGYLNQIHKKLIQLKNINTEIQQHNFQSSTLENLSGKKMKKCNENDEEQILPKRRYFSERESDLIFEKLGI